MGEGLSLQGATALPLVVYLASRPGPATGVPTYTLQGDMDIALRSGHGEFPRVVIAPGDPKETIEKVNEAFYLANKFGCLVIILSDKHVAESDFSTDLKIKKPLVVKVQRAVPGEQICRADSYEHDKYGMTIEDGILATKNADARVERYHAIKKECKKFEMIKFYGRKSSKNLIIGWGSTKHAIIDAIDGLDYKFLQVLYLKPFSDKVKEEMLKAKKVILVENNLTGQLGRVIREKTGVKIEKRILKYDGRPFMSDELRELLK
jgi:2-oxoglutarate ferredoxin oxidoreductase subunit alpha